MKPVVCALGVFDGIHRGHQAVIGTAVRDARRRSGRALVLTFDRHPEQVVAAAGPEQLTGPGQAEELMRRLGAGRVVRLNFTPRFARMSAEDFVRKILVRRFRVNRVIIGRDFRFGRGRLGNAALLKKMGRDLGFNIGLVRPVRLAGRMISSTVIRRLVHAGRVAEAGLMLGRPYELSGRVVRGIGLARRLGFPTANLGRVATLVPANGVYAVKVRLGGKTYGAIANIGQCPTVRRVGRLVREVHLFGYQGDLYGRVIKVRFIARLRPERCFRDRAALTAQIGRDVVQARKAVLGT